MGGSSPPKPGKPPPPVDETKAILNAIAYANTQKKLRSSQGRKSTFLTSTPTPSAASPSVGAPTKTLLGQ
jgi:hypothetical protein